MKNKKIIKWLALILWMAIIFILSHQPYSGQATYGLLEKFFPFLEGKEITAILNVIIRKCAHMTEYFILTFLIYNLLKEYKVKRKYLISIIICIIYASIDEIHQIFVPGRSGLWSDCIIDTIGGLIFCIIHKIKK